MGANVAGLPEPGAAEPEDNDLYSTRTLLPLIAGIATVIAGALMLRLDVTRLGILVALLDGGVLLVVVGAALYFLIGFWLIPASVALGGGAFLAAFEVASHLPGLAFLAGFAWLAIGILSLAWGVSAIWQRLRSESR